MTIPKNKIYDFDMNNVKKKLLDLFRKKNREATIADMVSATALPLYQIRQTIKELLLEYKGHLKLTESGEIMYYFPHGLKSSKKGLMPFLKKTAKAVMDFLLPILTFLFKIWIVVMLVGYFVLFVTLVVAAVFVSLAGKFSRSSNRSSSGRSSSGSGSFFSMRVVFLFMDIIRYSSIRRHDHSYQNAAGSKKSGKPLYKSVFAFVFGEENPYTGWHETQKKQVIQFIQQNKGIVHVAEVMAITGKNPNDAEEFLHEVMLEYEGEPMVTEQGTIYIEFANLMTTTADAEKDRDWQQDRHEIPFNNNAKKMNFWIAFINGFNIIFALYFFAMSLSGQPQAEGIAALYSFVYSLAAIVGMGHSGLLLILGIIPLLFSCLFYLIPILRRIHEKNVNQQIAQENLRKIVYGAIWNDPLRINMDRLLQRNIDSKKIESQQISKEIDHAVSWNGDYKPDPSTGQALPYFPRLNLEKEDLQSTRKNIKVSDFDLGKTIMDSNEDKLDNGLAL